MAKVSGFTFLIYVARTLGVAEYGTYVFVTVLIALLAVAHDLGLNTITIRELTRAEGRVSRLFWTNLELRLPIAMVLIGIVAGVLLMAGRYDALQVGVVFAAAVGPAVVGQVAVSILSAFGRFRWIAGLIVLNTAVTIAAGYAALALGSGLIGLATANLIAASLHAAVAVVALVNSLQVSMRPIPADRAEIRQLLRHSLPVALSLLFVTFYYKIDRILIGLLVDDRSVGVYDVAYRFLDGLAIVPTSLVFVLFPLLSRLLREDMPAARAAFQRSARWMFALGLPATVVVFAVGPSLVQTLFSPTYAESGHILRVLIWAAALIFPNALFGNTLVAANQQHIVAWIVGLGVFINVVLDLLLIPVLGLYGAAAATVAVEVWAFAGVTYYLGRLFHSYAFLVESLRPIVVSCVLGVVVFVARALPIVVLLPITLGIYLLLCFTIGAISIDEIKALIGLGRAPRPTSPAR